MTIRTFIEGDESVAIPYKDNNDGSFTPLTTERVVYLGEQTLAGNGANQAATIPLGTTTIWISSEGGAVYATINGLATISGGIYVADGTRVLVGPYSNLTGLGVFATSPAKAHIIYEAQ